MDGALGSIKAGLVGLKLRLIEKKLLFPPVLSKIQWRLT